MRTHLLAILWAVVAWPAFALEVRVPVESPDTVVLDEMLVQVTEGVAQRLTGQSAQELRGQAPALFSDIESLVVSYGYTEGQFLVNLDVDGLKGRLARAEIPLWEGVRPEFLLWATEERGLERLMVGLEPHPVVDALLANADLYGLPIRRPLMDLEDTLALSPPEVWGGFTSVVENASSRYGADHVVVIGDRPERNRVRYWLYEPGQPVLSAEIEGETAEMRASLVMDRLMRHAKELSAKAQIQTAPSAPQLPALAGSADGVRIQIRYADPIRLMALMDHLESPSSGVRVRAVSLIDDRAEIELGTELSLEATDRLISGFGQVQFVAPLQYTLN